jgi:monofunctional biosynthetic peptidoglycan transglycosylase
LVVLLGLPVPWALRWADPPSTSFMIHRQREARREGVALEIRQEWVPLSEIPEHLARAVLVAEDDRFRLHRGIDWRALGQEVRYAGADTFSWRSAEDLAALVDALRWGLKHRSELRGRSTLTQQLAKNLYFTPDRSFVRKVEERVVALRLERMLDKDRIFELYLNTAELGPGVFGVGAAARAYFGVPASGLTPFQSASLAGTLPHPLTSNPAHRPARMAWRRDLILARLAGRDVVIPDEPPAVDLPDLELPDPEAVEPPIPGDTVVPSDPLAPPDTAAPIDTLSRPDAATRPDTTPRPDTAGATAFR